MGAPARIWFTRALLLLLVALGVALVAVAALPAVAKICLFGVAGLCGGIVAFQKLAAFDPKRRIHWRLPKSLRRRKTCAITFDDGPSQATGHVLDVLAAADVKATFFVLANNALRHPELVRRAQADGHTIALHGTTHTKLNRATDAIVEHEVRSAINILEGLGVKPSKLYRTPHGLKNAAVFRVAARLGLELWAWSRGVWDTDNPPENFLVERATRFAQSGMVLLLHDGRGDELSPNTRSMLNALPFIIQRLRNAGFDFVPLRATSQQGALGEGDERCLESLHSPQHEL